MLVFAGMIAYLINFQVIKAETIINDSHNQRQTVLEDKIHKGSIISSDGNVLAMTTKDDEGNSVRYYPYNELFAHTVGYLTMGGYGLEKQGCYYMLTSNQNLVEQIKNDISGKKNLGDDLYVTLNSKLSKACYDALGDNNGSVIVLEPSTGKILSMVSKPNFNPNTLERDWEKIISDNTSSVLVNRATQGVYPPGSTFKIVTLLSYYKEHKDDFQKYHYNCEGSIQIGDTTVSCANGHVHGEQDLIMSFANSCNTSFINMGYSLNYDKYKSTAENLLFNSKLPYDFEYNKSQFNLKDNFSKWELAQTAFGQGETLVTPLHLALIGSAIANKGVLMKPYMMDYVESCDGLRIKDFKSGEYKSLMSEDEADFLSDCMKKVVEQSFGWLFNDADYEVAGKSGTAQFGTLGYEHSLFVSFSPVDKPEIVVVSVVEGTENRSITAAEVCKKVYDFYYSEKE